MSEAKMKAGRLRLSLIAALVCLLIIVNNVLMRMQSDISMYLGGNTVDESTLEFGSAACFEEGTDVATRIQEEGSVLLQNEDEVLWQRGQKYPYLVQCLTIMWRAIQVPREARMIPTL